MERYINIDNMTELCENKLNSRHYKQIGKLIKGSYGQTILLEKNGKKYGMRIINFNADNTKEKLKFSKICQIVVLLLNL